jgi:hypothetical protein
MKDIDIAVELLNKENLTITIVKNGKCFYKSRERGIKPLYEALINYRDEMEGASSADKIVGKGAALLYKEGKIDTIFAKIISESSLEVLEKENINIYREKVVPYIKNRDKNGMCPIETMALEDDNIGSLLSRIENFLKKNNLI